MCFDLQTIKPGYGLVYKLKIVLNISVYKILYPFCKLLRLLNRNRYVHKKYK